jgi:hypothetical protein
MRREKFVGELRGDIGGIGWVLIPSFRKTPKKEHFSQEMHLKIPLL